jgi:hypothetical protein
MEGKKVKLSLQQAVEAPRAVRLRGPHIVWTVGKYKRLKVRGGHVYDRSRV